MGSFERRLLRELDAWRADGLIDARQAAAIRSRYDAPADSGWGRLALYAVGAVVFGLGVILFFAYNWADMPKYVKLGVLFVGLLGAHGSGVVLKLRGRGASATAEGLHVLGTMLFGAGIWLVSQIYHLDNPYPDAFLAWILGALALAWALPSIPQALLGLVLVLVWTFQGLQGPTVDPRELPALLVAAAILPLAARQRSKTLIFFSSAALMLLIPFALVDRLEALTLFVVFALAAAFVGIGVWARSTDRNWLGPVGLVGELAYYPLLFGLTFGQLVGDLPVMVPENAFQGSSFAVFLLLALGSLGWAISATGAEGRREGDAERPPLFLVAASVVCLAILVLGLLDLEGAWLALPFNLILLAHGVLAILAGSRNRSWRRVVFGCLVVSAVTLVRFADLFDSLLARSAAFLLLGLGLVAVGHFYQRRGGRSSAMPEHGHSPDGPTAEAEDDA